MTQYAYRSSVPDQSLYHDQSLYEAQNQDMLTLEDSLSAQSDEIRDKDPRGITYTYRRELHFLVKLIDALCIGLSLWFICWKLDASPIHQALTGTTAIIIFQFLWEFSNRHHSWCSDSLSRDLTNILSIWLGVVLSFLLLAYSFALFSEFSGHVFGAWILLTPVALCGWRIVARFFLRNIRTKHHNARKVVIAGLSTNAVQLAETIQKSPWMGMKLIGLFDDRVTNREKLDWSRSIEGNFDSLLKNARERKVDVVYITLPLHATSRINRLVDELSDTMVAVYVVPELPYVNLLKGQWNYLGPLPTISIVETPIYGINAWFKRFLDITLGSLILLMIALPMLLISMGIKLSSPGPILFRQKRYGLDGKEIRILKFRTMTVCEDGENIIQAQKNDCRVTKFGAFLRRTSLDELPQFFNVMAGSMSIVGPRPHAVVHNELYRQIIKGYMLRHKVKPGITGWAQVTGWRGETDTYEKMRQRVIRDLWYIRNWSISFDLKIICMTIIKGFIGKNAF